MLRILVVGTLTYTAIVILLRASKKQTLAQMNAFDFSITVAPGASCGRILIARDDALLESNGKFTVMKKDAAGLMKILACEVSPYELRPWPLRVRLPHFSWHHFSLHHQTQLNYVLSRSQSSKLHIR